MEYASEKEIRFIFRCAATEANLVLKLHSVKLDWFLVGSVKSQFKQTAWISSLSTSHLPRVGSKLTS